MSFGQIPDTQRTPGVFVEVDPTIAQSGPGIFPFRALIIGQRTSEGAQPELAVRRITRATQAREDFGKGSTAHLLAAAWLAVNEVVALDVVALDDNVAGVPATGTITIGGSIGATETGTLITYVAGKRITSLAEVDTDTTAANLAAAINLEDDLPVTANAVGSVVTLTARNDGTLANSIDVRHNHLIGEDFPASITSVIVPIAGGSGDPDITDVWPSIDGTYYDVIVHGFSDTTNLDALKLELEGRADALVGMPGMGISGLVGTQAALLAIGAARNNEFECMIGMESFPGWGITRGAAAAGLAARYLQEDPVRPVTGRQTIPGYAPSDVDRFTSTERNQLLLSGISTLRYDVSDAAEVERLITTYQQTAGGAPDSSYYDVQTMFGLAYVRRSYVAHFATQFPNHKLADDGTPAPPGSAIVTPEIAKTDAVGWYRGLVDAGICEDLQTFREQTTVQRHASDPNRLEIFLAVNFVNQLRVMAALLQFRR